MGTPEKKVLLINSHLTYPGLSEGKLNSEFQLKAKNFFIAKGFQVVETIIEKGYDAEEEVEKHLESEIIILQIPINWFSAPWIYKKYVDEVFNWGLQSKAFLEGDGRTRENPESQYGTGGKMQGKKFLVSSTWNAPEVSFNNLDQYLYQGRSTTDALIHITSNYRFCGAEILPDYNCYDVYKGGDVALSLEHYSSHLEKVLGL